MIIRKFVNAFFRRAGWNNYSINMLRQKYKWYCIQKDTVKNYNAKKLIDKRIVIAGVNRKSVNFYKRMGIKRDNFVGFCCISEKPEIEGIEYIEIDDLLYEDINNLEVYEFEDNHIIRSIGLLHDIGINDSQILIMSEDYKRGSQMFDAYDLNLGLARSNEYSGFEVFKPYRDGSCLKIVTLGGSTSDPTLCNIKSWSEILWKKLNDMGINTCIFAGGVASYTVTQEWIKLYRDVIPIKPDIVISYSGTNDLRSNYYEEGHNFAMKYMVENIRKAVQKKIVRNTMQSQNIIRKITLGPDGTEDRAEHWIRCERMMHAICEMDSIHFLGFLQPVNNKIWLDEIGQSDLLEDDLYIKAKRIINELKYNWLIDLTEILNGQEQVFFDRAHVYEKGNYIIANYILKYVVDIINEDGRW